ncbi:hypothetical protein Emed_005923 [Eimeria media]
MDTKDAPQIVNHSSVSVSYVPHACRWVPNSLCCFAAGEAANRSGELEVYTLKDAQLRRKEHRQTKAGIKCLSLTQGATTNHSLILSVAASAAAARVTATAAQAAASGVTLAARRAAARSAAAAVGAANTGRSGITRSSRKTEREGSGSCVFMCVHAGHFDGRLTAWDAEVLDREAWSLKAHTSVLTTAEGHPSQPLVVTGGREGVVKVWDLRTKQQVVSLEPVAGEEAAECWSVCWGGCSGGSLGTVCCGYDNGDVKLFDLSRMQLLAETNLDYGAPLAAAAPVLANALRLSLQLLLPPSAGVLLVVSLLLDLLLVMDDLGSVPSASKQGNRGGLVRQRNGVCL